jgi:predicted nuclease with TOPRIM domain
MIQKLFYVFAATTLFTTSIALAQDYSERARKSEKIVVIDLGSESPSKSSSNKDLYRRLYRLEKAVRQLQERVFELETENTQLKEEEKGPSYTCYIKTAKGLFTSTQKSMTQAKTQAMQKCSEVIRYGFDCDEDKVKCGE